GGGRPGGGRPGGGRPGGFGQGGGGPGGGGPGGGGPGSGQSVTGPTTEQELVSMAQQQASSGQCSRNAYTCNGNVCSNSATSIFKEVIEGQWRILITNGIPSHTHSVGVQRPNPNEVCVHNSYMRVPLNPQKGGFRQSGMGPVGIALSGGFFYNHLDGNQQVAAVTEGATFDSCNGHPDPSCRYHYHKVPTCLDPGASCKLMGYMMDGFPVYSFCRVDGVQLQSCYKQTSGDGSNPGHFTYQADSSCHLDEANGYEFGGHRGYGYVFSENYPFIMRGFMGSQTYSICEVY
ncbi:unnamed protein product, partial [Meganyctiphanes norvegica]